VDRFTLHEKTEPLEHAELRAFACTDVAIDDKLHT
jgi:hypothetical protein